MSEYQYYEFLAVDKPLDRAAQDALRAISSRARITATSFVNHYEWGDLKGDPRTFMERWFDLHLYLANWGSRRLMMRLPARLVARADLDRLLRDVDWVELRKAGENLILDINRDEVEIDYDDPWDDGAGHLAALAPLRADVLSGDLRLFYLLWLAAVEEGDVADDEIEPLPGIAPLTGALEGFAEFFAIDADLVRAAAERGANDSVAADDQRKALAAIPERDKIELLRRVAEGDGSVAAELRRTLRGSKRPVSTPGRTAGVLRERARGFAEARERAYAEAQEAERRRKAAEAEKARRGRLDALRRRGEAVWREIETEIERRNPGGYDRATSLLTDLKALAADDGNQSEFDRRLAEIRARHQKKGRFVERLAEL
jgi:hypothetical protein